MVILNFQPLQTLQRLHNRQTSKYRTAPTLPVTTSLLNHLLAPDACFVSFPCCSLLTPLAHVRSHHTTTFPQYLPGGGRGAQPNSSKVQPKGS